MSATLTLDNATPLFLEFAEVAFHQTLRAKPWGGRTFIVQDPDGNLIAFAGHWTSFLVVLAFSTVIAQTPALARPARLPRPLWKGSSPRMPPTSHQDRIARWR